MIQVSGGITMIDFNLEFLRAFLAETNLRRSEFTFREPDEVGADITYIPSKLRIYWPGRIDSPSFRHEMEKCGVKETPKLRKGTQNYFRVLRREGKVLRVDSYLKGQLVGIELFHYEGNQRYSFPFINHTIPSPSYMCVLTFQDGAVTEEYMSSGSQIVHTTYHNANDGRIEFRKINYIPTGMYPINGIRIGYYLPQEKMSKTETYHWAWFMEPEAKDLKDQIKALPDFRFKE